MAPKRDVMRTDGMKITLGESTVTMWFTPGHITWRFVKPHRHLCQPRLTVNAPSSWKMASFSASTAFFSQPS
jgi:hypothetical protein